MRTTLYQAPAPPDYFAATEAWLSDTLLAQPGRSTAGGVPQGSPISGVLANVFLTAFDRSLERAGIVFLRYLDDVTILATSPAALAAGLGTVIRLLESLGMSLRAEKTEAAWLGGGEPPLSRLALPDRGHALPVAGEIEFLGIHFLGPERFRARETTVNRLLRRIRTAIVAGRGTRPARQRYFRACRRINELFGYELTGRARSRDLGEWRVRSAARMYEMEVHAIAHARREPTSRITWGERGGKTPSG